LHIGKTCRDLLSGRRFHELCDSFRRCQLRASDLAQFGDHRGRRGESFLGRFLESASRDVGKR
jgi:hypothetical protein